MLSLQNKRKRLLISPSACIAPKIARRTSALLLQGRDTTGERECGRLVTVDTDGVQVLVIELSRPFTIGRGAMCDYQTTRPSASTRHCRIFALTADGGEVVVCLEDQSTNGTMWNDRRIHRQVVLLIDGDRIEIGGQLFRYSHRSEHGQASSQATQNPSVEKQQVGHYLVLAVTLGTGSYAAVHLAFNTRTLRQVACKTIKTHKMTSEIRREVAILRSLHHPNINRVEDIVETERSVHIFLQLVSGGDLHSYLTNRTTLDSPEAKFILFQILQALEYLHTQRHCSHRDIKLENILLEGSGPYPKALLADFGHAAFTDQAFHELRGTMVYNPPEILTGKRRHHGYDGGPVDCWQIGIVLCMLLIGHNPFDDSEVDSQLSQSVFGESMKGCLRDGDMRTCANVVQGRIELPSRKLGSEDIEVRALIGHLLAADPTKRATARQALESRWIRHSQRELLELYKMVVLA